MKIKYNIDMTFTKCYLLIMNEEVKFMYCEKCGAEIDDSAVVCIHCGAPTSKMSGNDASVNTNAASNPLGIASLVCGIVGLIMSFFGGAVGVIGLILCVIAIVLSVFSKKKVGPNGKATAGLVLGIIGVILAVIMIIIVAVVVKTVVTTGLRVMS